MIQELGLIGMELMLARNCELVEWRDGRIALRLPMAQKHLGERAFQEKLRQALEKHLGSAVRLEISIGGSSGNTMAEIEERENRKRLDQAAAAIEADPFVRELVENLDARVLSSSIKPAKP